MEVYILTCDFYFDPHHTASETNWGLAEMEGRPAAGACKTCCNVTHSHFTTVTWKTRPRYQAALWYHAPKNITGLLQIFSQAVAPKITPLLESITVRYFFSLKCKMIVHWLSKISSSPQDITGLLEIFVAPKITPLLEISHFTASHCNEVNEKKTWHRHF